MSQRIIHRAVTKALPSTTFALECLFIRYSGTQRVGIGANMSKAFDLQGPTADEKFGECESVRYFTASFKFSLACTYSVVVYLRARVCTHTYNIIAQYLFLNTPHLSKPRLHPLPMIFVPSGVQMLIAWHHAGLPEKPLQIAHSYLCPLPPKPAGFGE